MIRHFTVVTLLLLIVSAGRLWAQTPGTGAISGRLLDSSGAVISGGQVSITNVGTGLLRPVKVNADGSFYAPLLPPGNYALQVKATGFAPQGNEKCAGSGY